MIHKASHFDYAHPLNLYRHAKITPFHEFIFEIEQILES